jgi:Ca2+-dependent lipid-binding protein
MHYLFVRIVKARALAPRDPITGALADPYVNIRLGSEFVKTRTPRKSGYPDWNQIFAFGKNKLQSAPTLEISVWDEDT